MYRKYMRTAIIGCVLGTLLAVYAIGFVSNLSGMFDVTFGYIDFSGIEAIIMSFARWMLPQMILLFLWGDFFDQNIRKPYSYAYGKGKGIYFIPKTDKECIIL